MLKSIGDIWFGCSRKFDCFSNEWFYSFYQLSFYNYNNKSYIILMKIALLFLLFVGFYFV